MLQARLFFSLAVLLCVSFSVQSQIKVTNPCSIDYSQLLVAPPGGTLPDTAGVSKIYANATTFMDTDLSSSDWEWDFGDGSPLQRGRIVQHHYKSPALYTVTLRRTVAGVVQIVTQTVQIERAPKIPILDAKGDFAKRDSSTCEAPTLDPYKYSSTPSGINYQWYPKGGNAATLLADSTGLYSVKITDNATGCSIAASILVQICGQQPNGRSIAQYHFGNGVVRLGDHGPTVQAGPYPFQAAYNSTGAVNTTATSTSIQNPNLFKYQQYLFSTDGKSIYNGAGAAMPTATGIANPFSLIGSDPTSANSMIVPLLLADSLATTQYLVFGLSTAGNLYYTTVETAGQATITKAPTLLSGNLSSRMALSPYDAINGFYYLLTQDVNGGYATYKISSTGITGPVITPSNHSGTFNQDGQMKFSRDGTKVATMYKSPPENFIEVCNFAPNTMALSGCTKILIDNNNNSKITGLEFSENGRFVYYTMNYTSPADGVISRLYRVELATLSTAIIDFSNTQKMGALQAVNAPDESVEILVNVEGAGDVGSIKNTNAIIRPLYLLSVADSSMKLKDDLLEYKIDKYNIIGNRKLSKSLFNFINLPARNSSNSDNFQISLGCEGQQISFQASPACDLPQDKILYNWDFGDGSTAGNNQNENHVYFNPGEYTVKLYILYPCKAVTVEKKVIVYPKVRMNLDRNIVHCFRTIHTLLVPAQIANQAELDKSIYPTADPEFVWSPAVPQYGNNNASFKTTTEGKFMLDIKNKYVIDGKTLTCESKDSTTIKEICPPIFSVPTVFTPNDDGINNKLEIKQLDVYSEGFEFRIYNRWGELVYFSDNLAETAWDGRFNNKACEPDSYVWTVKYRNRFDPDGIIYKYQGALLLLR